MDKRTLIKNVAKKTGTTQSEVRTILNSFIDEVNDAVFFGMNVKISEFVSFELKTVSEQKKRNPQNGKQVIVPKHYGVKVSASKKLKDRLKTKTVY